MSKPRYNISVPGDTYKKDGEEKRNWNNVGVAFLNEGGSLSCKLFNNISINTEFVLFPAKEKESGNES